MHLRRLLPAAIAAAALGIAGCGGDDAASPLDEALGHLPQNAGFALVASTEEGDYENARALLDRFPFGGQAQQSLRDAFQRGDINFDEDVRPLLGNELVLGVADNASFVSDSADTPFVLALETEDEDKLREIAESELREAGESEGYDLFEGGDQTWVGIDGAVVVLSNSRETLEDAVRTRGQDDRLSEDDVEDSFDELSDDTPVRAYVNVRELLAASEGAGDALQVKWVDHIRTLGVGVAASEERISFELALRTESEGLNDEDLPIASGDEPPQVLERAEGSGEVGIGLRDPSQVVRFAEAAARVVDPAGFAEYEAGKRQIGNRLDVDVDEDVIGQLTGDVAAAVAVGGDFGLRAELEDPDRFEDTVASVMDGLPQLAGGDVTVTQPSRGESFYGVATEDGQTYAVGVAEETLVVANNARLAGEVATRGLRDAEGLEGALVASADAEQLANALLAELAGGLQGFGGSLFTGPLGELTASISSSTDGMTGRLQLNIE